MDIAIVWIEEGCIACGACPVTAPNVFIIPYDGDTAIVLGRARMDGIDSVNERERSPLLPDVVAVESEAIIEAAEGCPVEVIRFVAVAENAARSA